MAGVESVAVGAESTVEIGSELIGAGSTVGAGSVTGAGVGSTVGAESTAGVG